MKKSIIIIIVAVLLLGAVSVYLAKNKSLTRLITGGTQTSSSSPVPPGPKPGTTSVHITTVTQVPGDASLTYKETGTTTVAIEVKGNIKNVKLVKVELNGAQLSVKDTIKDFGTIENKTLYITTTVSEGVPTEMLTWQSEKGANYSWIVGTNGATNTVDRTYNAIE